MTREQVNKISQIINREVTRISSFQLASETSSTLQFSNLRKLNIFSIIAENIKLANDKGRENREIAC